MKKRQYRRETEAVRGGNEPGEEKRSAVHSDLSDFDLRSHRHAGAGARHTTGQLLHALRQSHAHGRRKRHRRTGRHGCGAALLFRHGCDHDFVSFARESGDHIVAQRDIYGGVTKFLSQWLPKLGVETTFVDTNDMEQHERAIRPNTKILHIESPTNPTVRVVDLEKIAHLARKHKLISTIDSTFATPMNCRPAEWGIDLVLHSGTKYFGGHSDLICGIATGRRDLIEQIHQHAHDAWLLHGSTCGIPAAARDQDSGCPRRTPERKRVADRGVSEPASQGDARALPLLKEHQITAIAKKQMAGAGCVVSFEVEGSGTDACRVAEGLSLFIWLASLGGVDSLVTIPVMTSHAMIAPELRKKMGVTEQMIRLSVGIEHVEDLIADLEKGLAVLSANSGTGGRSGLE
jgi:cystathionine beta-lyase/cystathionine gamma-synthase